jgi:hypothetical protein
MKRKPTCLRSETEKAAFLSTVQRVVGGVKIEQRKLLIFVQTPHAEFGHGGLYQQGICVNLAVTI